MHVPAKSDLCHKEWCINRQSEADVELAFQQSWATSFRGLHLGTALEGSARIYDARMVTLSQAEET